ncbi:hypothetical protein CSKR_114322 [Clonorchis sinensis]|uniref:Uncharacterized protein n=1 Tax=Clonorchis sinensis TaxID=79923 RepID=A0A419Q7Y0_CLOSI|nr:hypothetical protein CSKR_114322 [Clonorchis sinensis]
MIQYPPNTGCQRCIQASGFPGRCRRIHFMYLYISRVDHLSAPATLNWAVKTTLFGKRRFGIHGLTDAGCGAGQQPKDRFLIDS